MNIRGKVSPVQSNIRTVSSAASTRQTPPPPQQIRGGHFEDPSFYQPHFQPPGPYQPPQQAYVDMNKPATGRVPGPSLAQPQGFNVQRSQHTYNPMVAESQDQQTIMWNQAQQNPMYIPNQGIRQQRMPTMNNGQVPGSGLAYMTGMPTGMPFIQGNMAPSYNSSQGMPFPVQTHNSQFLYSQPRLPYPAMQQQQQLNFMPPYGPAAAQYQSYYPPSIHMTNTNRPTTTGPQAVGGSFKQRSKKVVFTDPNTGEDVTEKILKPQPSEESDPSMQEVQAHRDAITQEFAKKVAILAKDGKNPSDASHAIEILPPAQVAEMPTHAVAVQEPGVVDQSPPQLSVSEEHSVVNGESQDSNIQEEVANVEPPVLPVNDIKEECEAPAMPVETAAVVCEEQTPSPALPASPAVPQAEPASLSPLPKEEHIPASVETEGVVAKSEDLAPTESAPVVEETQVAASASSAVAKMACETSAPMTGKAGQQPKQNAQPTQSARQDGGATGGGKRSKKNKKDINKKTKEGSDMDAFVDSQTTQDNATVCSEQPEEVVPATNSEDAVPSAHAALAEAACGGASETVQLPEPESLSPAAPQFKPAEAVVDTPESAPSVAVVDTPSETVPAVEPVDSQAEPAQSVAVDTQLESGPSEAVDTLESDSSAAVAAPEAESTQAVSQPEPANPVAVEASQAIPEVKVEEVAQTSDLNGLEPEPELEAEAQPKPRNVHIINGVQLDYKEGQWSPFNPAGKKKYDRNFLLKLQSNPESMKVPVLPDMAEIRVDPRTVKLEDFQRDKGGSARFDFTPGFFKTSTNPRSGGPGSVNKRGSQQGRRVGPGSQTTEQRIIPSTRQEITLHKSDNAYKPMFQSGNTGGEDAETQLVLRQFKSILNKLTPEKYDKLSADVMQLPVNTEERLNGIADLLFEKALAEPNFSTQYGQLCKEMLKFPKVEKADQPGQSLTFRAVILTKCQKEFEKESVVEQDLERRKVELEKASADQEAKQREELAEATLKARRRSMGNTRFIGELYRLKMLTDKIMNDCIVKLLKAQDDDSIECLTKLLETIGADLDVGSRGKTRMNAYFEQLDKLISDSEKPGKADPNAPKLSTRVRFGVMDIKEMRMNDWNKRKIHDMNKPTTIGEIHQKAKEESQTNMYLNNQHQPRMDPNPPPQNRGSRGKGRGSVQGDSDGWNTVPTKQVKQQIDATKMRLTKTNVEELSLGGGYKFNNWGRGSQGGGSRSQEQDKSGNRYTPLNNIGDSEGRRGHGRSPARGDSRVGSRTGGDRSDRGDRRDFRKPVSRSSVEERDRAVANTRYLLGSRPPSNPSSRDASRDNSRSRDMPPPPPVSNKVPSGLDVSQMDEDELNRRLTTIAKELQANRNMKEAREGIDELVGLKPAILVNSLMENFSEFPKEDGKFLGTLFAQLLKDNYMDRDSFVSGIKEFMSFAEDLALDVPGIWDNIAQIFITLFVAVESSFAMLKGFVEPLVTNGNKKETILVNKIFKYAEKDELTKEAIHKGWKLSGLSFKDFGMDAEESRIDLRWLQGTPRNFVYSGLSQMISRKASNEDVFKWIDSTCSKQDMESPSFVRELTRAIFTYYMSRQTLDKQGLKKRNALFHKYIGDNVPKGIQVLIAIQLLMNDLQHPQGLVRSTFDVLYDDDLVPEESFGIWRTQEGPPEDMAGKGAVLLNVRDFYDWMNQSVPSQDSTS